MDCTCSCFLFWFIDTVHIEPNYRPMLDIHVSLIHHEYAGRGNLERQLRPSKTTGVGIVSIVSFAFIVISNILQQAHIDLHSRSISDISYIHITILPRPRHPKRERWEQKRAREQSNSVEYLMSKHRYIGYTRYVQILIYVVPGIISRYIHRIWYIIRIIYQLSMFQSIVRNDVNYRSLSDT